MRSDQKPVMVHYHSIRPCFSLLFAKKEKLSQHIQVNPSPFDPSSSRGRLRSTFGIRPVELRSRRENVA